jgi:hypothetical protein
VNASFDPHDDPANVLEVLVPDQLRERLKVLDRQQRAVRILLRAAIAREKNQDKPPAPKGGAA